MWQAAVAPGDLLEFGGERARYRPISNRKVERGYGRYLTFLDGRGLLETGAAADRITPRLVGDYVQSLQNLGNGSQTILARLQELYEAAVVIGPHCSWSWIRRIASRIRARHVPVRKKASRLVTTDELVQLGSNLMEAARSQPTERLAAITFRDGLLISFVALCPLRRSNVAVLELGRHLVRQGEEWWIVIPGCETKNGEPEERPWPECLAPALEEWLQSRRPILCGLKSRWTRPIGNALWVSSHGSPMTVQAIYDRIVARTRGRSASR